MTYQRKRGKFLAIVLMVVSLFTVLSSFQVASAAPALDTSGTSGDYRLDVQRIVASYDFYHTLISRAEYGYFYVAVYLSAENTGESGQDIALSPNSFVLVDENGNSYTGGAYFGPNPEIRTGDLLEPGDSHSGWVNFQVPINVNSLTLEWRDITPIYDNEGSRYVYPNGDTVLSIPLDNSTIEWYS